MLFLAIHLASSNEQQIQIDNMQFGFMNGKGTTDAMFIVRQIQEKLELKERSFILALIACRAHTGQLLILTMHPTSQCSMELFFISSITKSKENKQNIKATYHLSVKSTVDVE